MSGDAMITRDELNTILSFISKEIAGLSTQLSTGMTEIKAELADIKREAKTTNGRVTMTEKEILQLQAKEEHYRSMAETLDEILEHGCHVRRDHEEELKELGAAEAKHVHPAFVDAGVIDNIEPSTGLTIRWRPGAKKMAKQTAKGVGILGAGAVIVELLRHFHDLIHYLTGVPK